MQLPPSASSKGFDAAGIDNTHCHHAPERRSEAGPSAEAPGDVAHATTATATGTKRLQILFMSFPLSLK
jgi:hypothetical protein